jgi:hypothetical protein
VLDHLARHSQVRQGREKSRQNAQTDREPWHVAATDEKIVDVALPPPKPPSDAKRPRKVQGDNGDI